MAQQSLYRRYRPRTFGQMYGQQHVVTALRSAVSGETEGHAYLFSGPRGTGKTSTARILAKALNCLNVRGGEPCLECESCLAIEAGTSYDLFELDAASHNGVEAMRELISRSAVGSPGRTKVYILDEVHMLSTAASNALLKTLEEPPDHVRFVLATTDPQRVLPTIRSRTQHFEFALLTAEELTELVRWVVADAELDVDEATIEYVVRQGRGSARDTLSALDQVVAAGGVLRSSAPIDEIVSALRDDNVGELLAAMSRAFDAGREPRVLAEAIVSTLRDALLAHLGTQLSHLTAADQQTMVDLGKAIGAPGLTRALTTIGRAIVDMRQAADPRIPLEVALIDSCGRTSAATSSTADSPRESEGATDLAVRVQKLERIVARLESGANTTTPSRPAPASRTAAPAMPPPPVPRREPPDPSPPSASAPSASVSAAPPPSPVPPNRPSEPEVPAPAVDTADTAGTAETTDRAPQAAPSQLTAQAVEQACSEALTGRVRAMFASAAISVDGTTVTLEFPNAATVERVTDDRGHVQEVLSKALRLKIELITSSAEQPSPGGGHRSASASPASSQPRSAAPPASAPRPSPPERPESAAKPALRPVPNPPSPPSASVRPQPARELHEVLAEDRPLLMVVPDPPATPGNELPHDEEVDVSELVDAQGIPTTATDLLLAAFEGAEIVEEDP